MEENSLNSCKVGNYDERSLCAWSTEDTLIQLRSKHHDAIERENLQSANSTSQLISLLEELKVRKVIPLQEACDFYYGGIKDRSSCGYVEKKRYRHKFKDKLLDPSGLPVIVITASSLSFVILCDNNCVQYAKGIDDMLEPLVIFQEIGDKLLCQIAPISSNAMQLLSANRDRSIIIYIFTQLFSSTSLSSHLGLSGTMQRQTVSYLKLFIECVDSKLSTFEQDADESIQSQIKDLQAKLEKEINILENKRDRLSHDLIEDKEFDISNKRQWLEKLKQNPNKMRKQMVYGMFNKWKKDQVTSWKKNWKVFDCSNIRKSYL